jgi:hypothetical protein
MTREQLDAAMLAIQGYSTRFEETASKMVKRKLPESVIAYNQLTLMCHVLYSALKAAKDVTPK